MHTSKVLLLLAAIACVPARAEFITQVFSFGGAQADITGTAFDLSIGSNALALRTTQVNCWPPGGLLADLSCADVSGYVIYRDSWTVAGPVGESATMTLSLSTAYPGGSFGFDGGSSTAWQFDASGHPLPQSSQTIAFQYNQPFITGYFWQWQDSGGYLRFGPSGTWSIESAEFGALQFGDGQLAAAAIHAPEPTTITITLLGLLALLLNSALAAKRRLATHCHCGSRIGRKGHIGE